MTETGNKRRRKRLDQLGVLLELLLVNVWVFVFVLCVWGGGRGESFVAVFCFWLGVESGRKMGKQYFFFLQRAPWNEKTRLEKYLAKLRVYFSVSFCSCPRHKFKMKLLLVTFFCWNCFLKSPFRLSYVGPQL